VLVEVRNDVLKSTSGKQVPWEHTSLTGQVYLRSIAAPPPPAPATPPVAKSYDKEMEIAFWNSVKDSKSPAVVEAYLERYPNGTFAGLARVMVSQLKEQAQERAKEANKVAALPVPETRPQPSGPDPQVLARALQTELKRVGCDPGAVDGRWGSQAREALGEFARAAKLALPSDEPTSAALDAVAKYKERVCPLECDRGEKAVDGRCVAASPGAKDKAARKPAQEPKAARRREAPEAAPKTKLCWSQDGRNFAMVPCPN
jgi:hypothetical protein